MKVMSAMLLFIAGQLRRLELIGMGVGLAVATSAPAVTTGELFPDVSVPAANGAQAVMPALKAEALNGKVTVINFWATWCEACKVEIGEMKDEFKNLLSKPEFNLAFVALDKDPSKAIEWFKANVPAEAKFLERLFIDPDFITADRLGIDAFPMTLIVGRDGKVVHVQKGFTPGEGTTAALAKQVEGLLK